MKKVIIAILFIALSIAIYSIHKQKQLSPESKPTIRIGTSLPLTGNLGKIGNSIKDALILAQREIPNNTKYNYEFFFEDDAYEYNKTALNTNNMISLKNVDIILSLYDGAAKIISPIAERNQIVHINCGWGGDEYKKYKYSFHHSPTSKSQAQALTQLLKDKGIKKVALVSINWGVITEVMGYLNEELKDTNIEVVSTELVNLGTKDFKTIIMKMKQQNPDIIVNVMTVPEIDLFAKQAKELDFNVPYTSIDMIFDSNNYELFEGSEFVLAPVGSPEFITKFTSTTGKKVETCLANFYDMIKIITNITEKFDTKPTPDQIVEELHKLQNYDSSVGIKITVDQNGIMDSDLIKVKIEDGKIKGLRE